MGVRGVGGVGRGVSIPVLQRAAVTKIEAAPRDGARARTRARAHVRAPARTQTGRCLTGAGLAPRASRGWGGMARTRRDRARTACCGQAEERAVREESSVERGGGAEGEGRGGGGGGACAPTFLAPRARPPRSSSGPTPKCSTTPSRCASAADGAPARPVPKVGGGGGGAVGGGGRSLSPKRCDRAPFPDAAGSPRPREFRRLTDARARTSARARAHTH